MSREIYVGAQDGRSVWAKPEAHVMALGPPRSGKTSCFMIPNVLAAEGPVISTSTKPDVLEATLAQRCALGRCWLFDPFNEVRAPAGVTRLRWSPVTECADWTVSQLMSADLVNAAGVGKGAKDPHWRARATAMLGTLMHASAVGGTDIDVVAGWVNRFELREAEAILADRGDPLAREVMAGLGRSDPRELSSVFSTATEAVAAYRTRPALESALHPNLAPTQLVASSDTIYVCASSEVQQLVAPTVAMLVGRACSAAYAGVRANGVASNPPLLLALDEVANIAPIEGLPRILSEGASQGVLVAACFQDLSQARERWGTASEAFPTVFGGQLIFAGIAHPATLQAISMRCGDVEVPVRTVSRTSQRGGRGRSRTRSASVTASLTTRRESALTPAELSLGLPGKALYLEGGVRPGWVDLTHWHEVLARAGARTIPVSDGRHRTLPSRTWRRRGDLGMER